MNGRVDLSLTRVFLYGSNNLSYDLNVKPFTVVQKFILDSGRFNNN